LLVGQKAATGLAKGTRGQLIGPAKTEAPTADIPTLASAGISHKMSSAAQKLAKPLSEPVMRCDGGRHFASPARK
jgi:hypothetical protein